MADERPRMAMIEGDAAVNRAYHVIGPTAYVAACNENAWLDPATETSADAACQWNPCHRRACRKRWEEKNG